MFVTHHYVRIDKFNMIRNKHLYYLNGYLIETQ